MPLSFLEHCRRVDSERATVLQNLKRGLYASLPQFSVYPHRIAEQQVTRAADKYRGRKGRHVAVYRRDERVLHIVPGGVILRGRLAEPVRETRTLSTNSLV